MPLQDSAYYLLAALALLSVGLPAAGNRFFFPPALVFAKWIRWALFAGLFAALMEATGWSIRPVSTHLIVGAGLWFLLETGYNWLVIGALSRSPLPLFPEFRENRDGDEWPADQPHLRIKDWLRDNGYSRIAALKAELYQENYLRASVYQSSDARTRIQILFIPKSRNGASAFFSINSISTDGRRLITDNHSLPFGGYYPENWLHSRKPLVGSLARLLRLHNKRAADASFELADFDSGALPELNGQQRLLENLNIENGIIVPLPRQEEEGKLTGEGRYRIWLEMWLLAYFGKARSERASEA
ncbi:MAG: hypothetical protein ACPGGJ_02450 [Coraliomargarita sp.]